jgi:hypothetical protein
MRILYVTIDKGGCRHYRCLLPAQELARQGHQVVVTDRLGTLPSGEITSVGEHGQPGQSGFGLVVLQRWMHEEAPRVIKRARANGQAVINDVDDWFFGIPTSNRGFEATHVSTDPRHNVEHYRKILACSSALTVSTPYLAERLKPLGTPTFVLRNRIDVERWPVIDHDGPPRIGWVGHVGYRAAGDLDQIRGVVGPWLRRNPDARFVHVGANGFVAEPNFPYLFAEWEFLAQEFCRRTGVPREQYDPRPLCHVTDLPDALNDLNVGLAPLEDCPFNRAKSAIKLMEYGARGIPGIASRMPEYEWFERAALCAKPKDWIAALDAFANPSIRCAYARDARERAESLDIRTGWPLWEAAYMETISRAGTEAVLLSAKS